MPGIYIFEDEERIPLYIGKSINLRSRLKQHYEGYIQKTTKAQNFIPQTKYLSLKILENDLQAIITESNYIKTYKPKYNAISKDNKSNIYIIFSNPPASKIKIVHATEIPTYDIEKHQTQIFGPYTINSVAKILIKQIRRIFGLCSSPFNSYQTPCFYHHLHQCPGACNGTVNQKDYQKHLGNIKKFLSGHFNKLNKELHSQIKNEIKQNNFEKAQIIKKQIESLDQAINTKHSTLLLKLSDSTTNIQRQIVDTLNHPSLTKPPQRIECYDLAHLQQESYVGSMAVFINSEPTPSEYRLFKVNPPDYSDTYAMRQIITRRLKHKEWGSPDLIVLDGGKPQLSSIKPVLPDNIPVIALAKRQETIYFYDKNEKINSLQLDIEDPVLNLFKAIRDEAHRLANSFHHTKQQKKYYT